MKSMQRFRRGWYGESHRHYLAAKGVRTQRYRADKEGFMDRLTSPDDGTKGLKQRQEQKVIGGAQEKVQDAIEAGEIRSGAGNRIMRDVEHEASFFRTASAGEMDYEMFQDNVRRIVDDGLRTNRTSLAMFDWGDK